MMLRFLWIFVGAGLIYLANRLGRNRIIYADGRRIKRHSLEVERTFAWVTGITEAVLITLGEWRGLFVVWLRPLEGRTAEEAMLATVMTCAACGALIGWISWWVARHSEVYPPADYAVQCYARQAAEAERESRAAWVAEKARVNRQAAIIASRPLPLIAISLGAARATRNARKTVKADEPITAHQPEVIPTDWASLVEPLPSKFQLDKTGLHLELVNPEMEEVLKTARERYEANLAQVQQQLAELTATAQEPTSTRSLLERLSAEGKAVVEFTGEGKSRRVTRILARTQPARSSQAEKIS